MLYKITKRLFHGTYQYKIVLICAGSGWFRSGNWDDTLTQLKKIDIATGEMKGNPYYRSYGSGIKTQEDLDYAFKLQHLLSKLTDIELRVESPWVSIYTNTKSNITALTKLSLDNVKYVSLPPVSTTLQENTIIMPKINFDYKVTIGKTIQEHSAFIQWAEGNAKLKLTKSVKKELSKHRSWGGAYFYLTGDNNLLMAKMHLGGSINKVERIIKA
jgi:hypothetical protein